MYIYIYVYIYIYISYTIAHLSVGENSVERVGERVDGGAALPVDEESKRGCELEHWKDAHRCE